MLLRSAPEAWLKQRISRAVSKRVPVPKHWRRSMPSFFLKKSAAISAGLVMVTTGQVKESGFSSFARTLNSSTERPRRSSRVWPGSLGSPMATTVSAASRHSEQEPARTETAWSIKLTLSATSKACASAFSFMRSTRTISSQIPDAARA